jgi:hypothetical protein
VYGYICGRYRSLLQRLRERRLREERIRHEASSSALTIDVMVARAREAKARSQLPSDLIKLLDAHHRIFGKSTVEEADGDSLTSIVCNPNDDSGAGSEQQSYARNIEVLRSVARAEAPSKSSHLRQVSLIFRTSLPRSSALSLVPG